MKIAIFVSNTAIDTKPIDNLFYFNENTLHTSMFTVLFIGFSVDTKYRIAQNYIHIFRFFTINAMTKKPFVSWFFFFWN